MSGFGSSAHGTDEFGNAAPVTPPPTPPKQPTWWELFLAWLRGK